MLRGDKGECLWTCNLLGNLLGYQSITVRTEMTGINKYGVFVIKKNLAQINKSCTCTIRPTFGLPLVSNLCIKPLIASGFIKNALLFFNYDML
jgi:hypothetical protein